MNTSSAGIKSEPLTNNRASAPEAEFQVKKLLARYGHMFAQHQWPSEHERWIELLFALACKATNRSEQEVRRIIEDLDVMDLLEVRDLANAAEADAQAARLLTVLQEARFSQAEANDIVLAFRGAARGINQRHGGKIQNFLRTWGQQMADQLLAEIAPPPAFKEKCRLAITYWLQNVLDMPIVLNEQGLQAFCTKHGFTVGELVAEADRQDLNVALLDDMIDQYLVDERKAGQKNA